MFSFCESTSRESVSVCEKGSTLNEKEKMTEIMHRLCVLVSGTFGFDESTTSDISQLLRANPLILEQEIGSHFCIVCASFWNEIQCERCKRVSL